MRSVGSTFDAQLARTPGAHSRSELLRTMPRQKAPTDRRSGDTCPRDAVRCLGETSKTNRLTFAHAAQR